MEHEPIDHDEIRRRVKEWVESGDAERFYVRLQEAKERTRRLLNEKPVTSTVWGTEYPDHIPWR